MSSLKLKQTIDKIRVNQNKKKEGRKDKTGKKSNISLRNLAIEEYLNQFEDPDIKESTRKALLDLEKQLKDCPIKEILDFHTTLSNNREALPDILIDQTVIGDPTEEIIELPDKYLHLKGDKSPFLTSDILLDNIETMADSEIPIESESPQFEEAKDIDEVEDHKLDEALDFINQNKGLIQELEDIEQAIHTRMENTEGPIHQSEQGESSNKSHQPIDKLKRRSAKENSGNGNNTGTIPKKFDLSTQKKPFYKPKDRTSEPNEEIHYLPIDRPRLVSSANEEALQEIERLRHERKMYRDQAVELRKKEIKDRDKPIKIDIFKSLVDQLKPYEELSRQEIIDDGVIDLNTLNENSIKPKLLWALNLSDTIHEYIESQLNFKLEIIEATYKAQFDEHKEAYEKRIDDLQDQVNSLKKNRGLVTAPTIKNVERGFKPIGANKINFACQDTPSGSTSLPKKYETIFCDLQKTSFFRKNGLKKDENVMMYYRNIISKRLNVDSKESDAILSMIYSNYNS